MLPTSTLLGSLSVRPVHPRLDPRSTDQCCAAVLRLTPYAAQGSTNRGESPKRGVIATPWQVPTSMRQTPIFATIQTRPPRRATPTADDALSRAPVKPPATASPEHGPCPKDCVDGPVNRCTLWRSRRSDRGPDDAASVVALLLVSDAGMPASPSARDANGPSTARVRPGATSARTRKVPARLAPDSCAGKNGRWAPAVSVGLNLTVNTPSNTASPERVEQVPGLGDRPGRSARNAPSRTWSAQDR